MASENIYTPLPSFWQRRLFTFGLFSSIQRRGDRSRSSIRFLLASLFCRDLEPSISQCQASPLAFLTRKLHIYSGRSKSRTDDGRSHKPSLQVITSHFDTTASGSYSPAGEAQTPQDRRTSPAFAVRCGPTHLGMGVQTDGFYGALAMARSS